MGLQIGQTARWNSVRTEFVARGSCREEFSGLFDGWQTACLNTVKRECSGSRGLQRRVREVLVSFEFGGFANWANGTLNNIRRDCRGSSQLPRWVGAVLGLFESWETARFVYRPFPAAPFQKGAKVRAGIAAAVVE